ncbi:hypothetical protein NQ317_018637 [Molorchus minor]|uniref:RNase H type-1 domain-containing protein n=1 Tax=Molorchus minor TaxID=1323400 RepID=A0ABQ9JHR1_9CUCU|nr:hypothetical protein NQ317_018637 [Molorchus minor]
MVGKRVARPQSHGTRDVCKRLQCRNNSVPHDILQYQIYFQCCCSQLHIIYHPNSNLKAAKGRTIQICSDSRAALLAIESSKVKSRLVLECKKTLNDLASLNKVILTWVPGHSGVREMRRPIDWLGKRSAMYPIGPGAILGGVQNSWHLTKCLLNRRDIRMVTGLLTGHCHLRHPSADWDRRRPRMPMVSGGLGDFISRPHRMSSNCKGFSPGSYAALPKRRAYLAKTLEGMWVHNGPVRRPTCKGLVPSHSLI